MSASLSMIVLLFALAGPTGQFPKPAADAKAGDVVVQAGKVGALSADFATLTVPESWDQPAKLIHLPVVRIRSAAEKAAEPVFYFHGGPGSSNIKLEVSYERLLKGHDVVLVGYRGVDGSVSLALPEFSRVLKTVADPLSAEGLRACAAAASRGAEKAKAEGIDVAQYDLDSTVRDIEAARRALGFDRISTSGSSFGGAVGYYYSLSFPDRVKRSALIEAAFPWNLGLAEPAGVDVQIRTFGKMWSSEKDISRDHPQGAREPAEAPESPHASRGGGRADRPGNDQADNLLQPLHGTTEVADVRRLRGRERGQLRPAGDG